MKNLLSTLLLIAAPGLTLALPSFDPFADASANNGTSYSVGYSLAFNSCTNADGTTNTWAQVNSNVVFTNPQPMVAEGNLSYPDLPASTGNSVSITPPSAGTGGSARVGLNAAPSTVYYSFILKVTDISSVPTSNANNPIAAFSDSAGSQGSQVQRMGGRLVSVKSGSGLVLGVGKGSTTTDYVYESTVRNVGDVLFVVVCYERVGGTTNVSLWVNPPSATFGAIIPPPPLVSVPQGSGVNDLNANGARAFVLSCQYANSPSCIVDEVRVATEWAIVTGGAPDLPITITSQPASRTVEVGDRVAFVVGANGTAPVYQWRLGEIDIPEATNASYAIPAAQLTNAGSYSVLVSNSLNWRTSAPAVLTVSSTPLQLFETNLIIVRVGDGAQTLATTGNTVYLDQYTPQGAYVNTVFVPDTGASAIIEAGTDLAGSVLTGTALTRSADKRLMVLPGYYAALGNPSLLHNTTSEAVPRAIVTVDSRSEVNVAMASTTAYTASHFRAAASDGTNNFWGSGSKEGTWYLGMGYPSLIQSTFLNTRSVDIFNGNLYTLASATDFNGLLKFNGLPKTDQGNVLNILEGFSSTTTTDFVVDPTDTLIYVTVGSSVQKWQFNGSTWTQTYALTAGLMDQVRYITADFSGPAPVLYLTTAEAGNGLNRLLTMVDTNSLATAVTLATSGRNQLFKGVRFGPAPALERPTLFFDRVGSDVILNWSGPFKLVSSTNVAGPYLEVQDSTSPYTNTIASGPGLFFGLR